MKRTAIFVDAGYLYAQGSACLQGSKAKRENLQLTHDLFVQKLIELARVIQPQAPLLRVYWYDGSSRGPTHDHRTLADLDNVKLRLGFINSVGQQKGVDSLLVTDLVELSRNGAICDAVLLGGDEDLRIGVQIAQSFGVRVHLLGIEPCRGSQSLQLRQEADTKHEITAAEVVKFLQLLAPSTPPQMVPAMAIVNLETPAAATPLQVTSPIHQELQAGIDSVLHRLTSEETTALQRDLERVRSVPALHDRRILASCRTSLGRDLTMDEKKEMRALLAATLRR